MIDEEDENLAQKNKNMNAQKMNAKKENARNSSTSDVESGAQSAGSKIEEGLVVV